MYTYPIGYPIVYSIVKNIFVVNLIFLYSFIMIKCLYCDDMNTKTLLTTL